MKGRKNCAEPWLTSNMIWVWNVKQLAAENKKNGKKAWWAQKGCYLNSHSNELHSRKSRGRWSKQSVQEKAKVRSKLLAGSQESLPLATATSITGCARTRTGQVTTGAQLPSPSSEMSLRSAEGQRRKTYIATDSAEGVLSITDKGFIFYGLQCWKKKQFSSSAWQKFPWCSYSHSNASPRYFRVSVYTQKSELNLEGFLSGKKKRKEKEKGKKEEREEKHFT